MKNKNKRRKEVVVKSQPRDFSNLNLAYPFCLGRDLDPLKLFMSCRRPSPSIYDLEVEPPLKKHGRQLSLPIQPPLILNGESPFPLSLATSNTLSVNDARKLTLTQPIEPLVIDNDGAMNLNFNETFDINEGKMSLKDPKPPLMIDNEGHLNLNLDTSLRNNDDKLSLQPPIMPITLENGQLKVNISNPLTIENDSLGLQVQNSLSLQNGALGLQPPNIPLYLNNNGNLNISVGPGLELSGANMRVKAGDGLSFNGTDLIIDTGNGTTTENGQLVVNCKNPLMFESGILSLSMGGGLILANGDVTLNIASNSGLYLQNNQLTLLLGPGLTKQTGALSPNLGKGLVISDSKIETKLGTGLRYDFSGAIEVSPGISLRPDEPASSDIFTLTVANKPSIYFNWSIEVFDEGNRHTISMNQFESSLGFDTVSNIATVETLQFFTNIANKNLVASTVYFNPSNQTFTPTNFVMVYESTNGVIKLTANPAIPQGSNVVVSSWSTSVFVPK